MHGKTMREALQEARDYRDDTNEGGPGSGPQKGGKKQSSADIKKAYGILNDPRYKQGNYSGAAKAIDKLSPGLSNHPDVKNAMKRANEESQITEKKAEFLRLDFKNKNEVEKLEGWMYKFISQVNAPYDSVVFNKHRLDGFSVEFEGMDDADALMTKLKRAGFRFKVDMRENLDLPATGDTTTSNASQEVETVELDEAAFSQAQIDTLKQKYSGLSGSEKNGIQMDKLAKIMKRYPSGHLNQLAKLDIPMVSKVAKAMTEGGPGSGPQVDVKQKKKDKADTQRLLDRQKRLQSIGKRNEEVVTEAVSDAYVKQIARMTDNNDHFGARIELARMMRDKELMQMYDSLEKMHRMNLGGNDALTLRSKLDKNLKFRLTQKVKKDADRLMGAL